jgi:hypothetical protein
MCSHIELFSGHQATLDAELTEHLRQGRLRLGQWLERSGSGSSTALLVDVVMSFTT